MTLPATVSGAPGSLIVVKAMTDSAQVKWLVIDDGLSMIPVELLKDSKSAIVSAARPGRYRLLAVVAKADVPSDPTICIITVGDAPTPPGPGPGPGPMPPADPLAQQLQTVYASETDPQKATLKTALAAVYRTAASLAAAPATATWGALFDAMRAEATRQGVVGKLPATQQTLAGFFKSKLPTNRTLALDAAGRAAAQAAFTQAAAALEAVR